jgi:hypothetical protein
MFIVDCVLEGSILSGLMIVLRCGLAEGLSSWGRPDLATELAWPYVTIGHATKKNLDLSANFDSEDRMAT